MPSPALTRFNKRFLPIANAIAMCDLDQTDRELVANAVTEELIGTDDRDFQPDLFRLLASDPLVPCAGPGEGELCPHGRVIRIGMHLSSNPGGRSEAWERRAPYGRIRCVSCGAKKFIAISESEMA